MLESSRRTGVSRTRMEGSTTEGDGRGDNNHRPMGNSYANTEPSRCRSTISTASCTLEEMQATLTRFRELCGALRTHFRSSPSAATTVDRSDQSLKQFSDCGLPQGFAVLRGVLSLDQQLELARKAMEEYAFYPHNNLTALGKPMTEKSTVNASTGKKQQDLSLKKS